MLGHPGHCSAVRHAFWARIRAGDLLTEAAVSSGVSLGTASWWFREAGGVMPPLTSPARKRPRLTLEQREDIAALHSQKGQPCPDRPPDRMSPVNDRPGTGAELHDV